MAPTSTLALLMLLCLSTVLTCSGGSATSATVIHMKLTHVDAKGSYTAEERVRRAAAATRQRLASLRAATGGGGVSAPVHWATRQYIAEYLVGNPPQRAEALIDTGSDLIWTQCTACLRSTCARQDLPYFNASASGSFAAVPCRDRACAANDQHLCALDGSCTFRASYGAGSVIGFLGTDAFAFQSGGAPALAFGCVTFTRVTPGALNGASGLIGLGRGRLSLVSQTGTKRFSNCLTPYFHNDGAASHLFVGAAASLGGGAVTSMTFVESPKDYPYSTFYYLPLVGITVGETKLPINSSVFELEEIAKGFWVGGVIIDSGSPFTSLVEGAYKPLRDELARQLNGRLVPPPGENDGMELCVERGDLDGVVPTLVFHFSGGADMALPPENYWAPVDKTTACMAILPGFEISIIGNFQQQNMHLLFDVGGGRFSFQNADCSTL